MIVKTVTVENVGLFRGANEFRLFRGAEPTRGKAVAVAGKNGVGKTTLFRAAPLALHGVLAVGDRVSQRDYGAFLDDLLHRTVGPDGSRQRARRGRVTVELSYVRSGRPYTATITREFRAQGAHVGEELYVHSDELDHTVRDPQAWVNDLLPPSVVSVWLFDAEDLGRLIGADDRAAYLKRTFQRLLGVHLLERLVADLQHYVLKSGAENVDPLRVKLLQARAALEEADRERTDLDAALGLAREQLEEASKNLRVLETELAAEGGAYAKLRDRNSTEAAEVEKKIARLEERLRQECDGLLPIAVSVRIHRQLRQRLEAMDAQEVESRDAVALGLGIEAIFSDQEFQRALERDVGVGGQQFVALRAAMLASARLARPASNGGQDSPTSSKLHDVSSSEQRQIRDWLVESGAAYRAQLHEVATELSGERQRLLDLKAEIMRAPDDAALAALHARIADAQRALLEVEDRRSALLRREGEIDQRRNDAERAFERARKDFELAQRHDQGVELAVRSRNASTVFQDALIRQKLGELEAGILASFNTVCRKQHLLSGVRIDPKTFQTELQGYRGHKVALEEFSAGERQLYNMAVFKAMRDVSKLDLPLFIDTPFARLDATHRQRLTSGFFKALANQVVLFMTDAEGQAFESSSDILEQKAYWLESDPVRQATSVALIGIDELLVHARETRSA